jgi:UDP-glucuronate 4-epimerase
VGGAERSVLVTGALGCIGAWTVRELLIAGASVVGLDPADDDRRLRQVTPPDLMDRVRQVNTDITDLASVERALAEHQVDRIIHLAALQLPFCRANPSLGATVNVVGTVNVFEAARRAGVEKVVYTSSLAVFEQHRGYLGVDAVPRPSNHYGVYKLANEGTARAYWHDFGVSSVGLRPMTVYGPGRDRGLTSSPTRAMLAAVLGCQYQISFGGRTLFHHAGDVAKALIAAVDAPVEGAHVFNLRGEPAANSDIVSTLLEIVGPAAEGITVNPDPIPFPDDVDTRGLDMIGPLPLTPLEEGIAATVRFFQDLDSRGNLDPLEHGLVINDGRAVDRETVEAR